MFLILITEACTGVGCCRFCNMFQENWQGSVPEDWHTGHCKAFGLFTFGVVLIRFILFGMCFRRCSQWGTGVCYIPRDWYLGGMLPDRARGHSGILEGVFDSFVFASAGIWLGSSTSSPYRGAHTIFGDVYSHCKVDWSGI